MYLNLDSVKRGKKDYEQKYSSWKHHIFATGIYVFEQQLQ